MMPETTRLGRRSSSGHVVATTEVRNGRTECLHRPTISRQRT